ncbi:hypothetical protein SCUCBS95973_003241 [Sporothrix curviconia]|uniref:Uncharacterized protein n=1 Tax=Sporothrix curviconia TaxID=1260050 RepID=A0ABP0BDM2_9PEZI
MTPPCYTFPAAELQERVQLDVHGRQRKMLPGSAVSAAVAGKQTADDKGERPRHLGINLARDCTLLSSMVQYSCAVMHPEMRDSPMPGPAWKLHGGDNGVGGDREGQPDWRRGRLKWQHGTRAGFGKRSKGAVDVGVRARVNSSRAVSKARGMTHA